jgi:hypothetical protein
VILPGLALLPLAGVVAAVFVLAVVFVLEVAFVFVFVTVAVQPTAHTAMSPATSGINIREPIFIISFPSSLLKFLKLIISATSVPDERGTNARVFKSGAVL